MPLDAAASPLYQLLLEMALSDLEIATDFSWYVSIECGDSAQ